MCLDMKYFAQSGSKTGSNKLNRDWEIITFFSNLGATNAVNEENPTDIFLPEEEFYFKVSSDVPLPLAERHRNGNYF